MHISEDEYWNIPEKLELPNVSPRSIILDCRSSVYFKSKQRGNLQKNYKYEEILEEESVIEEECEEEVKKKWK